MSDQNINIPDFIISLLSHDIPVNLVRLKETCISIAFSIRRNHSEEAGLIWYSESFGKWFIIDPSDYSYNYLPVSSVYDIAHWVLARYNSEDLLKNIPEHWASLLRYLGLIKKINKTIIEYSKEDKEH